MKHWLCSLLVVLFSFTVRTVFADQPRGIPSSADTKLMALAQEIAGFGGLTYEDGKVTVYLINMDGVASAQRHFGKDVRIRPATYEFNQLASWRERLRPGLSLRGAVSLDLDEARNRVVIGIDRGSSLVNRASFEHLVSDLQIPRGAVIIEEIEPIHELQTLRDRVTPTSGGVQIELYDPDYRVCTLGFNVSYEGGQGFVTNSHCTAVSGGEEGTTYTQAGVGIGVEERDPLYWTGGVCPADQQCRYSDSALISYAYAQENGAFNKLAKPDATGVCESPSNSITIDTVKPSFTVVSTQDSPFVGQAVEKIGRSSGWTTGTVTSTCVDVIVGDKTKLCQDIGTFGAIGGDSGSPVFHENANGDVVLDGLLWGSYGNCYSLFSHVSSIEFELGPMTIDAF